ncbi:hypothetical protein EV426DRAFT_127863 [Tirmania nivea]|nr:hypothetical protein EV426DRAFT_127863 [Tirmania nivea]
MCMVVGFIVGKSNRSSHWGMGFTSRGYWGYFLYIISFLPSSLYYKLRIAWDSVIGIGVHTPFTIHLLLFLYLFTSLIAFALVSYSQLTFHVYAKFNILYFSLLDHLELRLRVLDTYGWRTWMHIVWWAWHWKLAFGRGLEAWDIVWGIQGYVSYIIQLFDYWKRLNYLDNCCFFFLLCRSGKTCFGYTLNSNILLGNTT